VVGIRIKSDRSRGGLVRTVSYEDVCMRDVTNPIVLTSMYTTHAGTLLPVYRDILLKDVRSLTPGRLTFLGVDAEHKIGVTLDNVMVDGLRAGDVRTENAEVVRTRGGGRVAGAAVAALRDGDFSGYGNGRAHRSGGLA